MLAILRLLLRPPPLLRLLPPQLAILRQANIPSFLPSSARSAPTTTGTRQQISLAICQMTLGKHNCIWCVTLESLVGDLTEKQIHMARATAVNRTSSRLGRARSAATRYANLRVSIRSSLVYEGTPDPEAKGRAASSGSQLALEPVTAVTLVCSKQTLQELAPLLGRALDRD